MKNILKQSIPPILTIISLIALVIIAQSTTMSYAYSCQPITKETKTIMSVPVFGKDIIVSNTHYTCNNTPATQ